ncbi:MAG: PEP-CTERM sorting domain-containing protein [Pirellulales bacterium]
MNVHLSDTDTGVIRGYLQAVPEPGSITALALVSGLTILRRRRRKFLK